MHGRVASFMHMRAWPCVGQVHDEHWTEVINIGQPCITDLQWPAVDCSGVVFATASDELQRAWQLP